MCPEGAVIGPQLSSLLYQILLCQIILCAYFDDEQSGHGDRAFLASEDIVLLS